MRAERLARGLRGSITALVLACVATAWIEINKQALADGLAVDRQVSTKQSSAARTLVSPVFSTSSSNELILAFIASDGPSSGSQSIASVTGGGLSWRLRQRANTQVGTAEI